MKLFTVGPVEMYPETRKVASQQVPYFRNAAFSETLLECERLFGAALKCTEQDGYRMVALTCSGTGAMEACAMNCLGPDDRALVVDGGTFGHRFVQLLERHGVRYDAICVAQDENLTLQMLQSAVTGDHTALLINLDETSLGKRYDLGMVSEFCRKHDLFFIADAVSAFLADPIDVPAYDIDVLITGSQKALALQPGLALVLLSKRAQQKSECGTCSCMYFDFKDYLANGLRGQTPFTPAVGIVYELQEALRRINSDGVDAWVERTRRLAFDFRVKLEDSVPGTSIPKYDLSNALTPVIVEGDAAQLLAQKLSDDFGMVVNPCGGGNAQKMIRVSHIGNIAFCDNDDLIAAMAAILR